MEFETFVRKPFTIEAVEITTENIEEVAKLVGDLKYKSDGTPFIQADKYLIPNVGRVWPGFYLTKISSTGRSREHYRCYSKKAFFDQFVALTPEIKAWVDFVNGQESEEELEVVELSQNDVQL